jgi:hypothetical protein
MSFESKSEYSKPSKYLSEYEMFRYHAITTILQATNAIGKETGTASYGISLNRTCECCKQNLNLTYQRLANLTEHLTRHHEVVTVALAIDLP